MRIKRGKGWVDFGEATDAFRFPPPDGVIDFRKARRRIQTRERVRRWRERQAQGVLQDRNDRVAA